MSDDPQEQLTVEIWCGDGNGHVQWLPTEWYLIQTGMIFRRKAPDGSIMDAGTPYEVCRAATAAQVNASDTGRSIVAQPLAGIDRICIERQQQLQKWSPEHDHEQHRHGELARIAAGCAYDYGAVKSVLPKWGFDLIVKHRGNRLRQLTIAGALIAAEIDRLQRVACETEHPPANDVIVPENPGTACPSEKEEAE